MWLIFYNNNNTDNYLVTYSNTLPTIVVIITTFSHILNIRVTLTKSSNADKDLEYNKMITMY